MSHRLEFTDQESIFLKDVDFLLTKGNIIQRLVANFSHIGNILEENINFNSIPSLSTKKFSSKVSRGENYKGLPYVVLDHPAFFSKNEIFALRTIFWWGNNFSTHFLLKGKCLENCKVSLTKSHTILSTANTLIDLSGDLWNHDTKSAGYQKIKEISSHNFAKIINDHSSVKISWELPLDNWSDLEVFIRNKVSMIFDALHNQ